MFSLGLLSVFSSVLIPGLLIVRLLDRAAAKESSVFSAYSLLGQPLSTRLLCAVLFSYAWTHLKVLLLVSLGCFTQPVVLSIAALELAACLFAGLKSACTSRPTCPELVERAPRTSLVGLILSVAFVAAGLGFFLASNNSTCAIFSLRTWTSWDAVVSWNRWALDLARGDFPVLTWGYPQLLPGIWAYSYAFIGTTHIEFFAKAASDILGLLPALIVVDLLLRGRFVAGLALAIALWQLSRSPVFMWYFQGYADVPLAVVLMSAVYLVNMGYGISANSYQLIVAGLAITGLAAATKQQGHLFVFGLCALCFLSAVKVRKNRLAARRGFYLAALIFAPWALYYSIVQFAGSDISNVFNLIDQTGQKSGGGAVLERLTRGLGLWRENFGLAVGWCFAPAVVIGILFTKRFIRWITLFLTVPYFLIWCLGFSYDIRNAILVYPLLALAFAELCEAALSPAFSRLATHYSLLATHYSHRAPRYLLVLFPLLLVLVCLALGPLVSTKDLIARQETQNMLKGDPPSNRLLLDLIENGKLKGSIVTNYQIMCTTAPLWVVKPSMKYIQDPKWLKPLLKNKSYRTYIVCGGAADLAATRPLFEAHKCTQIAGNNYLQVWEAP